MEKLKIMENQGFTLIEFIIYVAIVAIILIVITGFFWNVVFGNVKETSYQEVQQNGRFVLTKMSQEIKKATGINNPSSGSFDNSLSLSMANSNLDPTIFDLFDGKLRITQGSNPSYYLTSDRVIVNSLQFANLSYPNTPGTVRIEMTINHLNPGNRIEYQASVNFKLTVSLVPGGAVPIAYCTGICTPCENFKDAKSCNAQNGCSWSGKLKLCTGICTPCDTFLDQPSCEVQSGCYWVSG